MLDSFTMVAPFWRSIIKNSIFHKCYYNYINIIYYNVCFNLFIIDLRSTTGLTNTITSGVFRKNSIKYTKITGTDTA